MTQTICVFGANGNLGELICQYLVKHKKENTVVKAIIRSRSSQLLDSLHKANPGVVQIIKVDYDSEVDLKNAVVGAYSVVCTLQGLEEVIVEIQSKILKVCVNEKVTRFIPSDFAANIYKVTRGENRNFDVRKKFHDVARKLLKESRSNIQFTSIWQGGFLELLTDPSNQMLDYQTATHNYIGSPDVIQDWTTWDNTAEFAAFALLDLNPTPNSFCIAGVQVTANDITSICSSATGVKWTSHQLLPLWALKHVIGVLKVFVSGRGSTLPIWQKLQYGYVQAKGECAHTSLDNHFYNVKWTGLTPLVKKEYIGSKAKGPAPAKKSGYGFPIAIAGVSLIGGAYYFRNQLRDLV